MRDTGCFNPVQPELVECEGDNQRQGFGHVAFAGMGRAAPIADHAVLPDTAPDISERYAADERVVTIAKDKMDSRFRRLFHPESDACDGGMRSLSGRRPARSAPTA